MNSEDAAALGAWLCERARAVGFDDAAVVGADVALDDVDRVREAVRSGRMGPLTWMAESVEQRTEIHRRWPWAKSVLVVVESYYPGDHEDHDDARGNAKVSRYAWGQDYHHVLRRKLRRLRKELIARAGADAAGGGDVKCAPFNDVDAVLERAWAKAAGIGFIGKSAMLIHRELGTWTFIGGLVTELDLVGDGARMRSRVPDLCGTCTACIDACPTHAIVEPHVVDANRCLVTWNVEEPNDARGDAPDMVGHGWAVGCDVCQEVCPWNRFERPTREERYRARSPLHIAFTPDAAPDDVTGTPLARPGKDALPKLAQRALAKRAK